MQPESQTPMRLTSIKERSTVRLKRKLRTALLCLGLVVSSLIVQIPALAQVSPENCGSHGGGYGPYDYRDADPKKLYLVDSTHFTPPIEALVRGHTSALPGPDLDYTLRAFPNHHRALITVMKYGEKYKTLNPPGMRYSVECWFIRALRFQPDDYIARMIYASFLNTQNRKNDALGQLAIVENEAKDNGFTHYNIGLVYLDMKEYDKALVQAHRALELGFNRPELRDMLEKAGEWKEPSASPTPAN